MNLYSLSPLAHVSNGPWCLHRLLAKPSPGRAAPGTSPCPWPTEIFPTHRRPPPRRAMGNPLKSDSIPRKIGAIAPHPRRIIELHYAGIYTIYKRYAEAPLRHRKRAPWWPRQTTETRDAPGTHPTTETGPEPPRSRLCCHASADYASGDPSGSHPFEKVAKPALLGWGHPLNAGYDTESLHFFGHSPFRATCGLRLTPGDRMHTSVES